MNAEQFLQTLNAEPDRKILDCKAEFLSLVEQLDIGAILSRYLAECLADYKRPPQVVNETTLTLLPGSWFNVDLTVDHCPTFRRMLLTHTDTILSFQSDTEYRLYELEEYGAAAFNPDSRIRLSREGMFHPGEHFAIDSTKHILSLRSDQPIVVISLARNFADEYACKFDADTGAPVSYFNTSPVTTVIEMMSKFLGAYGGEESTECLASLLEHKSDAVKWQAAQSLGMINFDAGIRAFKHLAQSSNPMLARTAQSTLDLTLGAA